MDSSRASARRSLFALGLVVGGYALKTVLASRARLDFAGKGVLITGGSRGLGLELARLFVRHGAKVAILARDGDELGRARDELMQIAPNADVLSLVCDIQSDQAVQDAVARGARRFGSLDVLVNNAGIIQVGPLEHMTLQDFDDALSINLRGAIVTTLAAIPHLKTAALNNAGRGGARIINITSFGGMVAVPHMAPYATAKFGFVGFSDAIRAELYKDGVRVMTVSPGTMRTGSHIHAFFKGQQDKEYAAFAATASAPVFTMNSEPAARAIFEASQRGDDELVLPVVTRLMVTGAHWFPNVTAVVTKLIARAMPGPTDKSGDTLKRGSESHREIPKILSQRADEASQLNNETASAQAHDSTPELDPSQNGAPHLAWRNGHA